MPSIVDIAHELNLSVSTVSRALNCKYGVNAKTRNRVLEAAKRLGYVPNLTAKDLVNKKSNLVSILMPVTHLETPPPLIGWFPTIGQTLQSHNLDVIVQFVDPHCYHRGDLQQLCRLRNTEGLIIMQAFGPSHPIYEDILSAAIPTVVIAEDVVGPRCSSIGTDEMTGGYLAVQHLAEYGHRQIGFITGTETASYSQGRVAGYVKAHEALNLTLCRDYIVYTDLTGKSAGIQAARLLSEHHSLTALMFANDVMALSAMSALAATGRVVPGDISIVGYDAMTIGEYTRPMLTSVRHNTGLGTRTAELLFDLIEGGEGQRERMLPTLVTRESVAFAHQ